MAEDQPVDEEEGGLPQLADRLNVLFAQVPRRGSSQLYSNERAAEELRRAGVPVTGAYLGQLRSGRKNNPSARLLSAIAELFDVSIVYFFDTEHAAKVEAQLQNLATIRSAGLRSLLTRASGVSEASIAKLGTMLEHIRELEGLPENEPPASSTESEPR